MPDVKPVSIENTKNSNESEATVSPAQQQQHPLKNTTTTTAPPTAQKTILTSSTTTPNLSSYTSHPSNPSSKPGAQHTIPVTNLDTNDWPSLNEELTSYTSLNISSSSTSKVSSNFRS